MPSGDFDGAYPDERRCNVLPFDVADGRIAACFAVRNPDKLARVGTV
jgi:hypothetical protein